MGTWKLSVVALAGMVGVYLGVLGYNAPHLNAGAIAGAPPGPAGGASSPAHGGRRSGGASPQAGSTATANGAGTSKPAKTTQTKAAAKGPLLSTTRWWPYAHQLYPGTPSAAARNALTGFRVSFSKAGGGLERVQVDSGRGKPQSATFRRTDRLYMIEGGMGDDGFNHDTNAGDDAFVLTDAGGHIVGK